MEFKVNIYIEVYYTGPAVMDNAGMWLIEYIKSNGTPVTRSGIIKKDKITENALVLELLVAALETLTKLCFVRVNTRCEHVLHTTQNHWLVQWKKNDWRNAKGREIKNKELWQKVSELMELHVVSFCSGEHSYRKRMLFDLVQIMER